MPIVQGLNDLNNALDSYDNIIVLDKFDGGLVDAKDADLIEENQLSKAENCFFDDSIINLIGGSRYYGSQMISGTIMSVFYFEKF